MTITIPAPLSERVKQFAAIAGLTPDQYVCEVLAASETDSDAQGADRLLRDAIDDRDTPITDKEFEVLRREVRTKIEEALNDPVRTAWTPETLEELERRVWERHHRKNGIPHGDRADAASRD